VSAAQQLDLDDVFGGLPLKPKKKRSAAEEMCKCGCELVLHAGKKHRGPCSRCLTCKKGRPKKKPPLEQPAHLRPPPGALILEREDLQRPKPMGWAAIAPNACTIYLEQLETLTPNAQRHVWGSKLPPKVKYAIATGQAEKPREWTISAIAQCGPDLVARGRPTRVRLTRVSAGCVDDDAPVGALKFVRDGVAKAFDFNDSEFSIGGVRPGAIRIDYVGERPGKQGIRGVRIELTWQGGP